MNLSINKLLINWGSLEGYLENGVIQSTKFGRFNQWATFGVLLFTAIKWAILIFSPQQSWLTNWLGDWGQFYGPKIVADVIIFLFATTMIAIKLLFLFSSKHPKKLFYWLDVLEYNQYNHSFDKLNLDETESQIIIKGFSVFLFVLKCFFDFLLVSFISASYVMIFILRWHNKYLVNFLISFTCFLPQHYLDVVLLFGYYGLLYLVSFKFQNVLKLKLKYKFLDLFLLSS